MDLTKLELELTRDIFKGSFYQFYLMAYAQLHPGEDYDDNWHAKYLCDILQEEFNRIMVRKEPRDKDIVINMPFRSSKSMITTVIFPVWCWSQNPRTKIISVSFSEPLALEHAGLSMNLIKSNWFQKYYGNEVILNRGAVSFYKTTAGGFRKSVGTGSAITGSGGDIIIVDDPINPKKAASETERQNALDFYDHTLYSRLNQLEIGVRIIVMQRLAEMDLSGHLLKLAPESHFHINIPANIDLPADRDRVAPQELLKHYKDNLFWESRFNRSVLLDFNKRLGEVQAAGQLQQRPAPAQGNLLKREWFEIVDAKDLVRKPTVEPIDFFLDTSYTEKQTNDPNGVLACFKRDNTLYITNVHEFYAEFPKLVEFTKTYTQQQGYGIGSRVFVEPKASGKSLVQQLRYSSQLSVIEIAAEFIRDDKTTRASAISPICQAGRVKLVRGEWNSAFLDQVTMFPNASHDEFMDILVYAVNMEIPTDEFFWGFM